MGLHVVLYIDDGMCASGSEAKLIEERDIILSHLEHAGFVLNIARSHLEPHQVVDWLEFIVDLNAGCFGVPADKIARLKSVIHSITTRGNKVAACFLASVVGQIISMSSAVGLVSRLRTRVMYAVLLNQSRFRSYWLTLSLDSFNELQFWKQSINVLWEVDLFFCWCY